LRRGKFLLKKEKLYTTTQDAVVAFAVERLSCQMRFSEFASNYALAYWILLA
jgi:hypothetical protein